MDLPLARIIYALHIPCVPQGHEQQHNVLLAACVLFGCVLAPGVHAVRHPVSGVRAAGVGDLVRRHRPHLLSAGGGGLPMVRRLSFCLGFSLFLGRIPEAVQEHRVPPSYIGFGEGEVFPK
jgi:hypothetical protein